MKRPTYSDDWPQTWRESYAYDRQEVFGELIHRGYAYAYRNRFDITLELVRQSAPAGARVLDVAAAQGNFSLALAEAGYRVVWNDLRAEMVDYVRLKHERGDLEFRPGNVFEVEFGEKFDVIIITEIIEHVAHPDDFLRKIAALLKDDGVIVMTTPNGGYAGNRLPRFTEFADPSVFESVQFKPNSDGHIFLLWEDEVRSLSAKAGLEVKEYRQFNTPLTNGYLKMEMLLKVFPKGLIDAIEKAGRSLPRGLKNRLMIHSAALLGRA